MKDHETVLPPTAAQIRALRMGLGESLDLFAQRVGVNRQTVHRWERGQNTPRGAMCKVLWDMLKPETAARLPRRRRA